MTERETPPPRRRRLANIVTCAFLGHQWIRSSARRGYRTCTHCGLRVPRDKAGSGGVVPFLLKWGGSRD